MSDSEADSLKKMRVAGVCPNCGQVTSKGTSVTRGAGSFCSLECVASYFSSEFSERARRLAVAAGN
jgi:hypothetical protein